jgi:hypothetical protein
MYPSLRLLRPRVALMAAFRCCTRPAAVAQQHTQPRPQVTALHSCIRAFQALACRHGQTNCLAQASDGVSCA